MADLQTDPASGQLSLEEVLQEALAQDAAASELLAGLSGELGALAATQYSRKVAHDQFSRLAESGELSLVTKHGSLETATVMMPVARLAALLVSVAQAMQARAQRQPLASLLQGLVPIDAPSGLTRVTPRLDQTRHRVQVAPAAVKLVRTRRARAAR